MKTKVKILYTATDNMGGIKAGMTGYIDGYVRGGNDVPLAVIVIDKQIDLFRLIQLEVIGNIHEEKMQSPEKAGFDAAEKNGGM